MKKKDEMMENERKEMEEGTIKLQNTEEKKVAEIDDRNLKEKLYDKIPISLKTLDIIITVLITIFVLMMLYFIVQKFS